MNRIFLGIGALSLLAMAAIAPPVHAQTANAGAISGSAADAAANARAGSAAVIQQTFQGAPAQQGVVYSGGTNSTTRLEGTQTLRNVPTVYAPALGGTNPCTQGASAGGAVAGFGISLGGQWSDPDCERRNAAALLHNTGQVALAQEVLCGNAAIREARQRLAALGQGALCAQDILAQQARGVPAGTPVVVAPAPVVYQQVVGGGVAPQVVTSGRPVWCETASAAERRQYRSTCG